MNSTLLDPRVSTKRQAQEMIISCAIVLPDQRLFVGRTIQDCYDIATLFVSFESTLGVQEGFLTSSGAFVTPEEAGKLAYLARQIGQYTPALKSADIF